ncbi:MAG: class I SAM-dependent methyltransferase [Chloroflexota bacterium]|nr:class I SAM-dependent methyltransferase [Chloroflexota bacterium]MDE2896849.1 class I SAM-dependent methyltransferase [Chloroflexota bacterium]
MTADADQRAARRTREHWEARYRQRETPWDDGHPWRPLHDLLSRFAPPGGRIVDIGCGLGGKAAQMASLGYRVLGLDISQAAIDAAERHTTGSEGSLEFRRANFLDESPDAPFDLAFDRSVWATFDEAGRAAFARRVARWLAPGGHWISLTGCADNRDPETGESDPRGYPRHALQAIAACCEPYFEILEVTRQPFGATPDTDFTAWVTTMRVRD